MKKIYLTLLIVIWVFPLLAQTNFRSLSYEEALQSAKTENKLVFIDFYTSWCGPCKIMMKDVFPQKNVGDYLNTRFVCIKLDAEKEGKEAAKHFGIKAYPTFIGVDGSGKVVMTKVGMAQTDEFIAAIERQIVPELTPERLKERYESGERTAQLISAYAGLKMEEAHSGRNPDMAKRKEAFKLVQDYFDDLKDAERLADENLFIYTTYTKSLTEPTGQYMIAHRNRFVSTGKEQIAKRIEELFKQEISNYLTNGIPYEKKTYQEIKKIMDELDINTKGEYTTALELIECHTKGDLNAWLTLCEKKYSRMPVELQNTLMYKFSSVINTQDENIRKRASKFIRSQLADMDASSILWVAMELTKLEGKDKH